jgi:hypothetical protein
MSKQHNTVFGRKGFPNWINKLVVAGLIVMRKICNVILLMLFTAALGGIATCFALL